MLGVRILPGLYFMHFGGKVDLTFLNKSLQFLKDVKSELKKVTWPTKNETINTTIIVIIGVLILSVFLSIVDTILSAYVRWSLNANTSSFILSIGIIAVLISGFLLFRWLKKKR